MHSLLETYLKEVSGHLAGLPAARRAEELREMRTHLENAVIVGRELGRTEEEAVRIAVEQFGTPGELGENLVQAWRREQVLNRRSLFGAAVCTVVVQYLVSLLVVRPFLMPHIIYALGHSMSEAQSAAFRWYFLGAMLISPIISGVVTAAAFPRKAVPGAVFGLAVWSCYWWVQLAVFCATNTHFSYLNTVFFLGHAIQNVEVVLTTLSAVWVVSWLRTVGQRRRSPAAAR